MVEQDDRKDVERALAEMQAASDGRPQAVLLRRMQLARTDPYAVLDLAGSTRAALHLACQRHTQQQVLEVSTLHLRAVRHRSSVHTAASGTTCLCSRSQR